MFYDITLNVDRIVRELRNARHTDKFRLLQEAIYYLPSLRNEKNIPLLAVEILNSPLYLPDLQSGITLIDAFESACMRKFQISDPTIPFEEWLDYMFVGSYSILAAATNASSTNNIHNNSSLWRIMPLLCGLIIAVHKIKEHHPQRMSKNLQRLSTQLQFLFSTVVNPVIGDTADPNDSVVQIAVVCISRAGSAAMDPEPFGQISIMALPITLMVFYQSDIRLSGIPAPDSLMMAQLSSVSLFIQRFAEHRHPPLNDLDELLNRLTSLAGSIYRQAEALQISRNGASNAGQAGLQVDPNLWNTLKPLCFGILIQLRGVASSLLHRRRFPIAYLAKKTLRALQPIHFIIEELGIFETYSFVFHVCVDVILESSSVGFIDDDFILSLLGPCNPGALASQVSRGSIVYTLDLLEMLVPKLSPELWDRIVFPFINEFLQPYPGLALNVSKHTLESAHSVMLSYLSNAVGAGFRGASSSREILKTQLPHYFNIVTNLFPVVLSHQQYTLTVSTIAKAVTNPVTYNDAAVDRFLNALFIKAKTTMPGIPLPEQQHDVDTSVNGQDVPETSPGANDPPTIRAVAVSNLIHILPLLNRSKFEIWLEKCAELTPKISYSPTVTLETEYLHKQLENMISQELDLVVADYGIRWWFARVGKI